MCWRRQCNHNNVRLLRVNAYVHPRPGCVWREELVLVMCFMFRVSTHGRNPHISSLSVLCIGPEKERCGALVCFGGRLPSWCPPGVPVISFRSNLARFHRIHPSLLGCVSRRSASPTVPIPQRPRWSRKQQKLVAYHRHMDKHIADAASIAHASERLSQ